MAIHKKSKIRKNSRKYSKNYKKYKKPKRMSCKQFLKKKIGINLKEFKNKKQAIAVSYDQIKKGNPYCKRWL